MIRRDETEATETRLAPITHQTLYERVYEELRKAIMGSRFAPGDTLTISGLAQQLGTSVIPVREAFRRLATEGALEILPNRTIRIPIMTDGRLRELRHIRSLLEGEASALAAARVTDAELATMEQLNAEFAALSHADDSAKMLAANQRFHFAVYGAAQSPTLLSLIGMLWLQAGPWLLKPLRNSFTDRSSADYIGVSLAHHRQLIDALRARDGARASAAIRADIRDAAERYLEGEKGSAA